MPALKRVKEIATLEYTDALHYSIKISCNKYMVAKQNLKSTQPQY